MEPVITYLSAKRHNQAGRLPLQNLIELAKYLEMRTAKYYNNIQVGGELEFAVFSDGKLTFLQPVGNLALPQALSFNFFDGVFAEGSGNGNESALGGFHGSSHSGTMVTHGEFSGITQPIDRLIFSQSTFVHCILTYDGSPFTVFDRVNRLVDCTLIISPKVMKNSPVVTKFKNDFPDVKISVGEPPQPHRWVVFVD